MSRTLKAATSLAAVGAATAAARTLTRPKTVDADHLGGTTAVVTGGASGIGRSLATLLADRGALVHVVDRDGEGADAVAAGIRDTGGRAEAHSVDVTDADAVMVLADAVFERGPVDLLFNNAGVGHAGLIVDTTLEDWRRLVDVNLMGVVHGVHAFLPRMSAQQGPSHIVNTASMAGIVPAAGLSAYSATKAAVVALTEALDVELIGTPVCVSALCPGVVNTAIVGTSSMSGAWADRRERTQQFYETRGTSPDVVAKQALDAVTHGRLIVPSPRYQVVPHWIAKRMFPPAGRALSIASYRFLNRD